MKHHYPNCDLGDRCNCQDIDDMTDEPEDDIYPSEAHMRGDHPFIANHLATIATLEDGIYTAQTGGKTYTWRAN